MFEARSYFLTEAMIIILCFPRCLTVTVVTVTVDNICLVKSLFLFYNNEEVGSSTGSAGHQYTNVRVVHPHTRHEVDPLHGP